MSKAPDPQAKWLRVGRMVYELESTGYRRGQEIFQNRWDATVQLSPGLSEEEGEKIAEILRSASESRALLNELLDAQADPDHGLDRLIRVCDAAAKLLGRDVE